MRRLLLGTLAAPVSAQAATNVQLQPFEATITVCNGDLVQLTGRLLTVISVTAIPSGGFVTAVHFQPQGVKGVDLTTGLVFEATGLTRDITVFSPASGTIETFVNQFHIQATAGGESFIVRELFHVTVTPDGTTAVFFDNFASSC
jgi:hypothetical protein